MLDGLIWIPENFDEWARRGCQGWDYLNVLPFFKSIETCEIKKFDKQYRGIGGNTSDSTTSHITLHPGPLPVTDSTCGEVAEPTKKFVEAAATVSVQQ